MLKTLSLILLFLFISLLIYIDVNDVKLLKIGGNVKENYYPYLRLAIAIILSFLILFSIVKKLNFYCFLNLLWLIPLFVIIIKITIGFYTTEKIDYFFGKTVNNYNIRQYEDRGWVINEITVRSTKKTDTIYVSENPLWKNKSNQLKNRQESKVVKSWITGYYYVSIKK